jgi:hypothetical protein
MGRDTRTTIDTFERWRLAGLMVCPSNDVASRAGRTSFFLPLRFSNLNSSFRGLPINPLSRYFYSQLLTDRYITPERFRTQPRVGVRRSGLPAATGGSLSPSLQGLDLQSERSSRRLAPGPCRPLPARRLKLAPSPAPPTPPAKVVH